MMPGPSATCQKWRFAQEPCRRSFIKMDLAAARRRHQVADDAEVVEEEPC